jgi:hypothetical protein
MFQHTWVIFGLNKCQTLKTLFSLNDELSLYQYVTLFRCFKIVDIYIKASGDVAVITHVKLLVVTCDR